ncbi:MAG: polysaccharide biosynthesis protein [Terracidiphilus sp.]|jgi:FlaA1/EpsC-like NDP-sugar epimerase
MQPAQPSNQIRDVSPEDLLGRPQAGFDQEVVRQRMQDKVVLVTGAAGSIGSELCRQIAAFRPRALVGFDRAEKPLLELARELGLTFPGVVFHAEIGNITRGDDVNRVMRQHQPSIFYHAAAAKHVPLMENHPFAAVENNVFGTAQLATSATNHRVEFFVLISTDKAVRPASIMGATKRVAELLIRALQQNHGTKFVAVRFGNVLGSSGSVVPIFKEQIAAGGPVTVTHPDMERYFMTPSEAGQLVLQATTLGKSGEVFVLEMGARVRIVDLARNLIRLSGLQPEHDIRIEFTGLRPGEKLLEELILQTEQIAPTSHPMIHNVISPEHVDEAGMKLFLEDLQQAVTARDIVRLIVLIKKMVPGYTPSAQLLQGAGMFTNISADQVSSGESDEASLVCPATIETA